MAQERQAEGDLLVTAFAELARVAADYGKAVHEASVSANRWSRALVLVTVLYVVVAAVQFFRTAPPPVGNVTLPSAPVPAVIESPTVPPEENVCIEGKEKRVR